MSSPDDNHDASNSSKSGSKRHLEDSSSDDSQFATNNNNHYENDSDLSGQSQTTSANNVVQNGTSSSRKAKKRKAKRAKERRGSKESALVGWNGAFPNLSSTHSLESNSDLEQQLPADLKAICATGLSVFPREEPVSQPAAPLSSTASTSSASSSPVSQQLTTAPAAVEAEAAAATPTPTSPTTTATATTTVTATATTIATTTATTTTTISTLTINSTCPSPTSTQTTTTATATNNSSSIASTATTATATTTAAATPATATTATATTATAPTTTTTDCLPSEPEPEPEPEPVPEPAPALEPEPESESETLTDMANQKRKRLKKQHSSSSTSGPPPTPPPAAAAAEESSNSNASGGGSSSKSSRKRAISSNAGSGSEQGGGDKKRLKKMNQDAKQQVDENQEEAPGKGGHNLRTRSKSLYELNTESPPRRMTRARSICAAAAADDIVIDKSLLRSAKKEAKTPLRSSNSNNNLNDNNKTGAKTPTRRRSGAAVKLPATDEFYTLPFRYGWRRELVLRSNPGSSRHRGDVVFIAPDGRKMRSREDILFLLHGTELTIDHFCFQRQLQHAGEPYETVRQAQSAPSRRKSLLAAKKQQLELHHQIYMKLNPNFNQQSTAAPVSATTTPVSGKRVPKPKVPKGASPPPEGWTSTMAVKGNARVLAASNGNSGSGSGSSTGNAARGKRGNHMKQSPKIAAVAAVQAKTQSQPQQPQAQQVGENKICVYCLQPIKEKLNASHTVGAPNNYTCKRCAKLGSKAVALAKAGGLPTARGNANGVKKQDKEKEPIDENVNANANGVKQSPAAGTVDGDETTKEANADADQNGGDGSGSGVMLEIGGEIELPGALPPDQLLSDDSSNRSGNKITAKPQEVVVINGRKALAIAGEPPRPRLQVAPREPDLEAYEKHYHPKRNSTAKEKRQSFIECIASGNQSCQVMLAVMKTLDLHDRVRMSKVCKTWAMIARDRSVWRTLKLRDTRITNWLFCLRDMARNRTRELDMMGVKMDTPKLRMEGDLRVLKSLRILRTDACEAEFIQAVIKRIPRLLELRTTCTSRALNLANIEKMVDLRVLRIRMTEPKAGIVSLQPLQKLQHLRELSLRGINNMAQLELTQLQELTNLETLVLGSSRGMKIAVLGQQVLPNLKKLLHLRIENQNNNRSFSISELMDGLAAGGGSSVKRLELVNVNVDAAFSRQLADCKSVQELLLMPNFHNNTAYMMHYVIQAINENCEQLNVFRLGLTYELLRVTRALAMNNEKDCVPVALPIPGVPENDLLNESDEPIAYLPVDRLESILHHMMPQAWLTVAKVSQSETCNLQFPASPKSDPNGSLHT